MFRLPSIVIAPRTPRPAALLGAVVASGPLLVAALSFFAAPTFFSPMHHRGSDLFGIPVQLIIMAFAVAWGAIGGYLVATSRQPWVLPVALLVFTFPAIVAIILGPAIILILQNLG